MRDAIDSIESALLERGHHRTSDLPRSRLYAPCTSTGADFWLNAIACALPSLGVAAMRLGTGLSHARAQSGPVVESALSPPSPAMSWRSRTSC